MSSESCAEVTAHSAKTARAAEDKLGVLGRCLALRYMPMGETPVPPVRGDWLDTNPIVPSGRWFKRFPAMTVCGEGELVKTVLSKDQSPCGEDVV